MQQSSALTQFSQFLLALYRSAQEVPLDRFQDHVLEAIKPVLPFDKSMWGTATITDAGIDIHSLHLHNTTPAMIEAYEKVKHLDGAPAALAAQRTATLAFRATDWQGEAMAPMRAFLEAERHHHSLITSDIHPVTRFAHWVSLYRTDPGRPYTPGEIETFAGIAPHVMQALAINRLEHLHRLAEDAARARWCVAIADRRGVLYQAGQRFIGLLAREWPVQVEAELPASLRQPLLAGGTTVTGRQVVVRSKAEHGLLFLEARERAPVDDLTVRELAVARLLATGMTQEQVAAALDRSPATIRSQVKSAFGKLGINSVVTLGRLIAARD